MTAPRDTPSTRDAGLDAARGLLMLLGIALHAANIYAPQVEWIVSDHTRHPAFGWLSQAIHAFRMHAFYWIAGYFCALVQRRRGTREMLESRVVRLALPLIAGVMLLNKSQDLFIAWLRGGDLWSTFLQIPALYHLWFLLDLLIYTMVAVPILALLRRRPLPARAPAATVIVVAAALVSFVIEAAGRATGVAYVEWHGLSSIYRLTQHLPFFVAGLVMYDWAAGRERFLGLHGAWFWGGLACAIAIDFAVARGHTWFDEPLRLLHFLAVWLCVGALIGWLRRRLARPTVFSREAADSAYTIYLVHHLLVVVLGAAALRVDVPDALEYVVICIITACIGYALHVWAVRPSALLLFVLNGKRRC